MIIMLLIFTLFLTILSMLINNLVVWWSIFLLMTINFIILMKNNNNYSGIFNYFVIQESLGLLFLIFSGSIMQFFIILMKIGVAPLHFWIFSVTNNIFNYSLVWFLTFQKLPFLMILLQIFIFSSMILLFMGLLVCYMQMFILKNYKNLLIISSTESFSWIIFGLVFSFLNSIYLFMYYLIVMVFLVGKFSNFSNNFLNLEMVLIFLNIPFSMSFFIKIFSLVEIFKLNMIYILILLFMMFMSVLAFSFWLINYSMINNSSNQVNNKNFYFIIIPIMLLSII